MIIAIMSGGDWNDASVTHVVLPEGVSVQAEHEVYKEFLQNRRLASDPYMTFHEFLISRGATEPTADQLTEFWEL